MPIIKLTKISSIASPDAVYIARNLETVKEVCRLIGSTETVWTKEQLVPLSKLATSGTGCHMHDNGHEISFVYPEEMTPDLPPNVAALALFMDAYVKWNDREDGGEDDLHYAYKVAGYMESDEAPTKAPEVRVVCELIEQTPCVAVFFSEEEALGHAVECAIENMFAPADPEDDAHERDEAREDFRDTLKRHGCIQEGDYEVHLLQPTNTPSCPK